MKIEMSLFTVTFLQSTKTMELRSCDKKMFRVPQWIEVFSEVAFYFSRASGKYLSRGSNNRRRLGTIIDTYTKASFVPLKGI